MAELATALAVKTAPKEQTTILAELEKMRPQIERALPNAYLRRDPDRFVRLVMTELRRTPKLMECTPASLLGAMMLSAQLGLEPGPLGHAYLVPFGKQVTFVLGYTGIVELAYRGGQVKSIQAQPVYENEAFRVVGGSAAKIIHELLPPEDRGDTIKAYYALAKLRAGGETWKVLYPAEIEARRKRSAAKDSGPWVTDTLAMSLKTCLKALRPWIPLSAEFGRGLAVDETVATWEHDHLESEIADAASVEAVSPDEERES